jgi:predicted acylesterase/phospholipase RssA
VVGTSAGSVVGALYASGYDGFALQKIALEMDEATISDWAMPLFGKSTGVLKGRGAAGLRQQGGRQPADGKTEDPASAPSPPT